MYLFKGIRTLGPYDLKIVIRNKKYVSNVKGLRAEPALGFDNCHKIQKLVSIVIEWRAVSAAKKLEVENHTIALTELPF